MRSFHRAFLLTSYVCCVLSDVFLTSPQGSNNKLNEQTNVVANPRRLFNSQNFDKGGALVGDSCEPSCRTGPRDTDYDREIQGSGEGHLRFYADSVLEIHYASHKGCSGEDGDCQIILQYMCDESLRDGERTDTIPARRDSIYDFDHGMHESFDYFEKCSKRRRNSNLYTADVNLTGTSAQFTRQNGFGDVYGFECQEERDYYPYWHPTPWRDIAVLTTDEQKCSYYQTESQNTHSKGECITGQNLSQLASPLPNNREACFKMGFQWVERAAHGIDAPTCGSPSEAKDAHYAWRVPSSVKSTERCALRIRYNTTSTDTEHGPQGKEAWTLDMKDNHNMFPWGEDQVVRDFLGFTSIKMDNVKLITDDILNGKEQIKLSINTKHFGRTFEDRSHFFSVSPRPEAFLQEGVRTGGEGYVNSKPTIYNLNVKGRRGNAQQIYPLQEYSFAPTALTLVQGDYLHIQWTDSDAAPEGNEGHGLGGSGKSNLVFLRNSDLGANVPSGVEDHELNPLFTKERDDGVFEDDIENIVFFAHLSQERCEFDASKIDLKDETDLRNCAVLNRAPSSIDGGLVRMGYPGRHAFFSTRNNDFSNRQQKGVVEVLTEPLLAPGEVDDRKKTSEIRSAAVIVPLTILTIIGASFYTLGTFARRNPHKSWAQYPIVKRVHNVPDMPDIMPAGSLVFYITSNDMAKVPLSVHLNNQGKQPSEHSAINRTVSFHVETTPLSASPLSPPQEPGEPGEPGVSEDEDVEEVDAKEGSKEGGKEEEDQVFNSVKFCADVSTVMGLPYRESTEVLAVKVIDNNIFKVTTSFAYRVDAPAAAATHCIRYGASLLDPLGWEVRSIKDAKPEKVIAESQKRANRNWRSIQFVALTTVVLFCWGVLSHRHHYSRHSNVWFPLAKGGGVTLNFMLVLLPLTTMKVWLGALRDTPANQYIDLDSNIELHKLIAKVIFGLMVVHISAHLLDAQWFMNRKCAKPYCIDRSCECVPGFWGMTYGQQLRSLPGWTGVIITILFLTIYFNALPSRRFAGSHDKKLCPFSSAKLGASTYGGWDRFWYTHHMYIPAYLLLMLHAPRFYCWSAAALMIFALEKSCSYWRLCQPAHVQSVTLVSRDVMQLTVFKLGFRHLCGQYVKVLIPELSHFVSHPFTVSSAPERDVFSVHIRSGKDMDWTSNLRDSFFKRELKEGQRLPIKKSFSSLNPCPLTVAVDGPFSTATQQFVDYNHVLLVGAGIGVTPFASILKAVLERKSNMVPSKVYFYWLVNDETHFEWFEDLMNDVSNYDKERVEITTYMTGDFDVEAYRDRDSGWKVQRTGRPNWRKILPRMAAKHAPEDALTRISIGVFFCGPPELGHTIAALCDTQSTTNVKFDFHKEVF